MSRLYRFSSSLRTECLEMTLTRAREVARELGISRVTDITRLDYVGVPVFSSIRPAAQQGSLCVNAGKGLSADEARVGAYMEAIEFAFAEYNRSGLEVQIVPARKVYDGHHRPEAILDFCPVMGAEIDLDAPIACVEAEDVCYKKPYLVPAELVFFPFPAVLTGAKYFGSGTNGLSSGNSVLEATLHGLAEVIERDICSFESVNDRSALVRKETLPQSISTIASTLSSVGLQLRVRHAQNIFGLPYFMAVVAEPRAHDPIYISVGYGCNPSRQIALTRAVCEALQSRLSFIHGGRDDLIGRYQYFAGWAFQKRKEYAERLLAGVSRGEPHIGFHEVPDFSEVATDLGSALDILVSSLRSKGFRSILRIIYTPKDYPVQVVRVIVPGLEYFNERTTRVGPRLRDYVRDRV